MKLELHYQTPIEWAEQAYEGIDDFLQDHADSERKVSNLCLSIITKYPNRHEIIDELTQIAVEELLHFKQVFDIMQKRNLTLRSNFKQDQYIKQLSEIVREDSDGRFMDRLILASIAEMRGSERFGLLGQVATDPQIAKFYKNLHIQEMEHIDSFIKMAKIYFPEKSVNDRVKQILEKEAEVTASLPWRPALH
ncbi:MAG: tRNA-(ms[2]io[6]A)-hydroxylase [Flavobacteriales bacterium]|nr:tRNA-(ms[2]io[6]A)-hydroxylase [Flavobacteriales bacterium]